MVKSVDTRDLKSLADKRPGSNPGERTKFVRYKIGLVNGGKVVGYYRLVRDDAPNPTLDDPINLADRIAAYLHWIRSIRNETKDPS